MTATRRHIRAAVVGRLARFVAFVLVIGALAAPTAAAHHLGRTDPDRGASGSGINGGVVALVAVGLLGLTVGAAVLIDRRHNRLKGVAP